MMLPLVPAPHSVPGSARDLRESPSRPVCWYALPHVGLCAGRRRRLAENQLCRPDKLRNQQVGVHKVLIEPGGHQAVIVLFVALVYLPIDNPVVFEYESAGIAK